MVKITKRDVMFSDLKQWEENEIRFILIQHDINVLT